MNQSDQKQHVQFTRRVNVSQLSSFSWSVLNGLKSVTFQRAFFPFSLKLTADALRTSDSERGTPELKWLSSLWIDSVSLRTSHTQACLCVLQEFLKKKKKKIVVTIPSRKGQLEVNALQATRCWFLRGFKKKSTKKTCHLHDLFVCCYIVCVLHLEKPNKPACAGIIVFFVLTCLTTLMLSVVAVINGELITRAERVS